MEGLDIGQQNTCFDLSIETPDDVLITHLLTHP